MATVYQSMQLYEIGNIEILNEHLLGMFLSFIFSYITIHLFISTINKISFTPYIIYRLSFYISINMVDILKSIIDLSNDKKNTLLYFLDDDTCNKVRKYTS